MAERIRDYETFFDFYLREHARPATRVLHYLGTITACLMIVLAVLTQLWWLIPVGIAVGYADAWIAHYFIEKNRPATFTYPLWSLASDFKMLWLFATGRLGAALKKAGVKA